MSEKVMQRTYWMIILVFTAEWSKITFLKDLFVNFILEKVKMDKNKCPFSKTSPISFPCFLLTIYQKVFNNYVFY